MDTKKLRQKILDLAIRGKLVPQDPNDEPASVLLERIRAEKERLIKEGKIKRNKKEASSDTSHYRNLPFELPEGWVWARLGDLCDINPKNSLNDEVMVSFIPMTLISDGFSNRHTSEIRKWEEVKKGFTHFREGDVGLAKITPCFENRKSVVFQNIENGYGAGTTELHILRPLLEPTISNYIIWFVKTESFIANGINCFTGAVGQQRVGKNIIEETYLPLPPLEEQKRIVSEIQRLFSFINSIEENKLLLEQFVKQTKSKILNLAIRGKLVPQDPNDEPASILLERIKTEYSDTQKKASKTRDNSHYENMPFEIPENWTWCQLEEILDYEQPTDYIVTSTDYSSLYHIPVLTAGKSFIIGYTNETEGIFKNLPVIIFDDFTTDSKYVDFEFKVKSSAMKILKPSSGIDPRYVYYFMNITRLVGQTHKRYWISEYSKLYIPLPPYNEQLRIVHTIKLIFNVLNNMLSEL